MKEKQQGLTLVELIVVISVSGILLTLAAPSMTEFVTRNSVTTRINQLVHTIHMARQSAIFRNRIVTLCRSDNGTNCQGQWHEGMLLFVDSNNDRTLDEDEELIYRFPALRDGDLLFWRAFRNRQYLLMTPRGFTAYQNGTFTYCPKEGLEYAKAIIINAAGRLKLSKDKNADGIDEGANGRPLRCS